MVIWLNLLQREVLELFWVEWRLGVGRLWLSLDCRASIEVVVAPKSSNTCSNEIESEVGRFLLRCGLRGETAVSRALQQEHKNRR